MLTVAAVSGSMAGCGGEGPAPGPQGPTAIALSPATVSLRGIGTSEAVAAAVTGPKGESLAGVPVSWVSGSPGVAAVSGSGSTALVTSVSPGQAIVTASVGSLTATVAVSVLAEVSALAVTPAALALTVGDESSASVSAASTADTGVVVSYTWVSGNPQVATVVAAGAAATVSAVAVGTTVVTVTARTQFGTSRTATVAVGVALPVRAVVLSPRNPDVGVGRTGRLQVRVTGDATFPRTLSWASSAPAVAQVSANGDVTGMTPGAATLRAVSTADATIRDSVIVTVTRSPYVFSDFVRVPAGTFIMGSDRFPGDSPAHQVTLTKSFGLLATEVTRAQWRDVMGNDPSAQLQCASGECPVQQVTWQDAQLFLEKLNALLPGITHRLPTEAEWEYAARATTTGSYYGDEAAIAWLGPTSGGSSHRVGTRLPNAWGLFDMLGNVGEWVEDFNGAYPGAPVTDPTGPATGFGRGIRGGAWDTPTIDGRVTWRGGGVPGSQRNSVGFRIVRGS